MRKQRVLGACMILLSLGMLALAATGTTPEEQDVTAVLLTLPLGIWMVCTRDYILNEAAAPERYRGKQRKRMKGARKKWQGNGSSRPRPFRAGRM